MELEKNHETFEQPIGMRNFLPLKSVLNSLERVPAVHKNTWCIGAIKATPGKEKVGLRARVLLFLRHTHYLLQLSVHFLLQCSSFLNRRSTLQE